MAENLTRLGSIYVNVGDVKKDVKNRSVKAISVFRRLQTVWGSKVISIKAKLRLYNSIVVSTALYVCETWKVTTRITNLLNVLRNGEVLSRPESRYLSDMVAKRRIQLTGHILLPPQIRPANAAMKWIPHGEKRHRCRRKKTCRATVQADLRKVRANWHLTPKITQDRLKWNQVVARCCTAAGETR